MIQHALTKFATACLFAASITACSNEQSSTAKQAPTTAEQKIEQLTVGFQKSALNLVVAQQEKWLEQQFPDAKIEWREFPAGPQMLEALAVGAVDFGYVGNTPPIFAQSADKALYYIASEPASFKGTALLVPGSSNIQRIEDLKGKRVAVQKGSNAHELLAKVLQKAGLAWTDIEPIWLPPADARAAFSKGSIDAWAIWDPYSTAAIFNDQGRVLIDGQAFPATYLFYVASPSFVAKHPQAVNHFIESINLADKWVQQHPQEAAAVLASATGIERKIADRVIENRPKPATATPLNTDVITKQQAIADQFHQLQLIPKQIDVKQSVWPKP